VVFCIAFYTYFFEFIKIIEKKNIVGDDGIKTGYYIMISLENN